MSLLFNDLRLDRPQRGGSAVRAQCSRQFCEKFCSQRSVVLDRFVEGHDHGSSKRRSFGFYGEGRVTTSVQNIHVNNQEKRRFAVFLLAKARLASLAGNARAKLLGLRVIRRLRGRASASEHVVDALRIGAAAGLLHDLPDEPAEHAWFQAGLLDLRTRWRR